MQHKSPSSESKTQRLPVRFTEKVLTYTKEEMSEFIKDSLTMLDDFGHKQPIPNDADVHFVWDNQSSEVASVDIVWRENTHIQEDENASSEPEA